MTPETWTAWAFGFAVGATLINAIWIITTPRNRK
ncbi:hypothetical protein JOE69_001138 [Arthrobacter russicus]|uniref:Uncharacterized protein n=1 Tax=Arthrobacter russicus TaxID=172040 RepID=A0ABU1J9T3_9MICC|nr:hypothetical protein [Arthrobacter russicus]